MKLANGPLESGTYIAHTIAHPGQYHTFQKDNGGAKLGLTENLEHEGLEVSFNTAKMSNSALRFTIMQWVLESMGNDRYKAVNKKFNMGVATPSEENLVVEGAVEGPTEWIIKPTDIEGEYM